MTPGGFAVVEMDSGAFDPDWPSTRSEEHTSELQSHVNLVCRLLLEKKTRATSAIPSESMFSASGCASLRSAALVDHRAPLSANVPSALPRMPYTVLVESVANAMMSARPSRS